MMKIVFKTFDALLVHVPTAFRTSTLLPFHQSLRAEYMYSSNMYKGIGVHGITIKRLSALEVIVFGLSNAFFLPNFFGYKQRDLTVHLI